MILPGKFLDSLKFDRTTLCHSRTPSSHPNWISQMWNHREFFCGESRHTGILTRNLTIQDTKNPNDGRRVENQLMSLEFIKLPGRFLIFLRFFATVNWRLFWKSVILRMDLITVYELAGHGVPAPPFPGIRLPENRSQHTTSLSQCLIFAELMFFYMNGAVKFINMTGWRLAIILRWQQRRDGSRYFRQLLRDGNGTAKNRLHLDDPRVGCSNLGKMAKWLRGWPQRRST